MQRHSGSLFVHLLRLSAVSGLVLFLGVAQAGASTIVDLSTTGSTATLTSDSGSLFYVNQIPSQSTGTGVIDSFLRIQPGGSTNSESGYNTDTNNVLDNLNGSFTHALLLSAVPIVTFNGVDYREFYVDVNQTGSDPLLSLNQLQFFTAPSDPGNAYTQSGTTLTSLTGATQVFRMSDTNTANADSYDLKLNYNLNPGSGAGDYRFLIASSLFGTATNVILYSQFGSPTGTWPTNDGFEEWFVARGLISGGPGNITEVPEPASLLLLGTGIGLVARRVRRKTA